MIDPVTSLAMNLYANKRAYAVLIGSGVSRAASIPTGAEVTDDLIRRVAGAEDEDPGEDVRAWYRERHGAEPTYPDLLAALAGRPAERSALLRGYFEPSDSDGEEKRPTAAHRALARLIRDGYVSIVLTTNFDRLIEQALEAEGIQPTVLSSGDDAEGAGPPGLARAMVVKLHGDYRDERTRNTLDEVSELDPRMADVLDRILADYGLLVCGWSADYDSAIRDAFARSPNRRFSIYWTVRSTLGDQSSRLVANRAAIEVPIESADEFMVDLERRVRALESMGPQHPLSPALTTATVKRLVRSPSSIVELDDILVGEARRVREESLKLIDAQSGVDTPALRALVERLDGVAATIVPSFAALCYWGDASHALIRQRVLETLGSFPNRDGLVVLAAMRRWPGARTFLAAALAAVAAERYDTLGSLCTVRLQHDNDSFEAVEALHPLAAQGQGASGWFNDVYNAILENAKKMDYYTPHSEYLHGSLRADLREYTTTDENWDELFDRTEYLIALKFWQARSARGTGDWARWAPIGRFGHRRLRGRIDARVERVIAGEADEGQQSWAPVAQGLFQSREEFDAVSGEFQTVLDQARNRRMF